MKISDLIWHRDETLKTSIVLKEDIKRSELDFKNLYVKNKCETIPPGIKSNDELKLKFNKSLKTPKTSTLTQKQEKENNKSQ